MATIVKAGEYAPTNLVAVARHFGKKGEDAPLLALLEQGADPNTAAGFGKLTALHWAASFDRLVAVRALLKAGADPNRAGIAGATPLMRANSAEVARLLLAAGADVNAVTDPNKAGIPAGSTALMAAVREGLAEVVEVLLSAHADMNLCDEGGRNALMLAALADKSAIVHLLREAGANVGLVEASVLGDTAHVTRLLAAEADLNAEQTGNALGWAALGGHAAIVSLLLDNGAPIDASDATGTTALMKAAQYKRMAVMRLLSARRADPNVRSHRGGTALMGSIGSRSGSNREAVELLLKYGAQVNVQSLDGWTPLMLACLWGDTEVVEMLLQHGADPNVFTDAEVMAREEGCSTTNALILAVGNGHIDTVKALLQYDADPLAPNNADISALDLARRRALIGYKQAEVLQILPLLEAAVNRA